MTTKTELLDFIRSKVPSEDFKNPVSMFLVPKTGWKYEIMVPITNVLEEDDVIWISNAFSNTEPRLTMQQLMSKLLECDNDKQIIIEVYGCNGESNDQFIYSHLNSLEDIHIFAINDTIYFRINVDKISTYPTT